MIPTWLKDKQPEDLPNLQTVMDIFVELDDTKKYSIQNLQFDFDSKRPDLNFNDICFANFCYAKFDNSQIYNFEIPTSTISVIEKKYRIRRLKWRFVIDRLRYKMNEGDGELKEVLLRLKDYLGDNLENIYGNPFSASAHKKFSQIIIDTLLYQCDEV